MPKAKQQPSNDEITGKADKKAKEKIITVILGELVKTKPALDRFMTFPMPLLTKMDLSVMVITQIKPQIESFFTAVQSIAKEQGVTGEKDMIKPDDFPSTENYKKFTESLKEVQEREITLTGIDKITFSRIRGYIKDSGIDAETLFVGDEFTRLTWLIDLTA